MTSVSLRILSQELDHTFVDTLVQTESENLGISVDLMWYTDVSDLFGPPVDANIPVIYITTPDVPDFATMTESRSIRCDISTRSRDTSRCLDLHIQGRGVDGIRWALRAATHRTQSPPSVVYYGDLGLQFGELRLPSSIDGRIPFVVLIHGGYWRGQWQLDLMDALARDLLASGIATWNVEYRPGQGGHWNEMTADTLVAVTHMLHEASTYGLNPNRFALIGHSAGAQLAAWTSTHLDQPPHLIVHLAGVLDLIAAADRGLSHGAVCDTLGGLPSELPDLYRMLSPLTMVPLGVDQLVVTPLEDDADLIEMARRYCARARAGGDRVQWISQPGNHFSSIDPDSAIWRTTSVQIIRSLKGGL